MQYIITTDTLDLIVKQRNEALTMLVGHCDMHGVIDKYKKKTNIDLHADVEKAEQMMDEVVCYNFSVMMAASGEEAEMIYFIVTTTNNIVAALELFQSENKEQ